MQVHRNLSSLPVFRKAVVTIGSFDGVHRGHQALLKQLQKLSAQTGGEQVLVTFDPHPRIALGKAKDLQLLNTLDEKIERLAACGIDHCVVVPFSKTFAAQTPKQYIEEFLMQKLHTHTLVIGYDHRFGADREGDVSLLRKYEEAGHFQVLEIPEQQVTNITVSSTNIRQALSHGHITEANEMLGYPFQLSGKVVAGQQLGRQLGFPTANILPDEAYKLIPADGIYAVRATVAGKAFDGMLYIGQKPTLSKPFKRVIEVNLFDFDADIYGQQLSMQFIAKTRDDQAFANTDELKQQLQKDKQQVLSILQPNKKMPVVATVILNYNGEAYLKEFIPVLLQSSYENHRIIVADNASTDGSIAWLKAHHKDTVELIELPINYGFAQGYNEALTKVYDADYVVLLNSDVEVSSGWIEPLVNVMESSSEIAACQPKIRAQYDRQYFEHAGASGGWIDALGYAFCRGRVMGEIEMDEGQYDDLHECFWATGAAMMIRPQLFAAMGGFDGSYFAHYEEIDLCWRLKRAGFRIMAVPQSVVYHVGGGTLNYQSPRKKYLNFRNSLYTLYKNSSRIKCLWAIPLRLCLDGLAALLFLTEKDWRGARAVLQAHGSFYHHFPALRRCKQATNKCIRALAKGRKLNKKGRFRGSMVWSFYVLRRKHFSDIVEPNTDK